MMINEIPVSVAGEGISFQNKRPHNTVGSIPLYSKGAMVEYSLTMHFLIQKSYSCKKIFPANANIRGFIKPIQNPGGSRQIFPKRFLSVPGLSAGRQP